MQEFGARRPNLIGRLILASIRLGLGRGKLKHVFGKLWQTLNLGSPVDVIYNGLKLRLFTTGNTIETKMLFGSKIREKVELKAIKSQVAAGGVFVDVGANIGYYSLATIGNGASQVLAFEPNPKLLERFERNVDFNGFRNKIEIRNVALGAKKGVAKLNFDDHDLGTGSLKNDAPERQAIEVEVLPLADVLADADIERVDAMKIDVEGMEDVILKPFFETAPDTLFPKMMVIEDCCKSEWDWDIIAWMLDNGYSVESRTRGNLILTR